MICSMSRASSRGSSIWPSGAWTSLRKSGRPSRWCGRWPTPRAACSPLRLGIPWGGGGVGGMGDPKGVVAGASIGDSGGAVLGDPTRIRQIVWNLLTNAIKATPAGGVITIGLDRAAGKARLEVTDTGVGIAPDFLPRIFDVFSQAQPSQSGGLGLGLAIVRHVVEQHHGMVQATSLGVGQGATFTVTLPLFLGDAVRGGVLGLERVRAGTESRDAAE